MIEIKVKAPKLIKLSELVPFPENENTHNEEQVNLIFEHIKKTGLRKAFVVSKNSGFMVTGHGTRLALLKFDNPDLEVPVDFQSFTCPKEELEHRVADNELASLSSINQMTLETNLTSLDIDLGTYDFSSVGLVDFTLLENQADMILADDDQGVIGDDLPKGKSSQSKSTVEIDREVMPGMKHESTSRIPEPSEVKEISTIENLSDFAVAPVNVFDARLTSWQVRSREWQKVFSEVHTHDLVLLETLAKRYAPNGATIAISESPSGFVEALGFKNSNNEYDYFLDAFSDDSKNSARLAESLSNLTNDSFYSLLLTSGFCKLSHFVNEIKDGLLIDSAFYIPPSFDMGEIEQGETMLLGYPVLTFVKGDASKALEKIKNNELKDHKSVIKEFYASVISETDF